MDPTYVSKVQEWVECDNVIAKHKEDMKTVHDKKKTLEDDIIKYVEDHKYDKLIINITDGHIKFGKRKVTQSMSMKTLAAILDKYSKQHETLDVQSIMKFVDESLETKSKTIMSREFKHV